MKPKKIALIFVVIFISALVGTIDVVNVYAAETLLDSYGTANRSQSRTIWNVHPSATSADSAVGQTFTTPNDGVTYTLTVAQFQLQKVSSPAGVLRASLWAHTGTWSSSGLPTGNPLATSGDVAMSGVPTSYGLVNFTFTDAYTMINNTHYCIAVYAYSKTTLDASNYIYVATDYTSPSHGGNGFRYASSAWSLLTTVDVIFYVYGEPDMLDITVTSSPDTGTGFILVDSVIQTTPYATTWIEDSTHTITAYDVANIDKNSTGQTQYDFVSWDDAGALSHTVAPSVDTTYTVTYANHFLTNDTVNGKGWSVGNTTGYSQGWAVGNASGYAQGWTDGNETGYTQGYNDGWVVGNAVGYITGWGVGNASGWIQGNASGWILGNGTGYTVGWAVGNATGYALGFADGLASGGGGNNYNAEWSIWIIIAVPVVVAGIIIIAKRRR